MKLMELLSIKKEERAVAIAAALLALCLNALVISRYHQLFMEPVDNYWKLFIGNFRISGFDPITYSVVSNWHAGYNIYRHPLLAFLWYPAYLLNAGLMALFGINLVQFIVAAVMVVNAVYAAVFLFRILRELIGLGKADSFLLCLLLFSFGYVMIAICVPDHFALSMTLLILTIYLSGRKVKTGRELPVWQTVALFVLTAGVSLNNGVKTFIAALFVNGKRFFRPRFLLLAVILPAALMWGFCRLEYRIYELPKYKARQEIKKKKEAKAREKLMRTITDTIAVKDSAQIKAAYTKELNRRIKARYKRNHLKHGEPLMQGEFMGWTDVTTDRWSSAVENLFGESIQLHRDHLLEDTLRTRPVIVRYRHLYNYVVEGIIVLLFLVGIWCGRRSRLLWMALSFFAFDLFIHFILGFGINEIYIMSPHWAFIFPLSFAFALRKTAGWKKHAFRTLLILLTLYLLVYNGNLVRIWCKFL